MSIQSEINRINNNVQESLDVCRDAGVSVASDANSDALPAATAALSNEKASKAGDNNFTGKNVFYASASFATPEQQKFVVGDSSSAFVFGADGLQTFTGTNSSTPKNMFINYYGGDLLLGKQGGTQAVKLYGDIQLSHTAGSDTPVKVQSGADSSYIGFQNKAGNVIGYYGVAASGQAVFYDSKDRRIYHEGYKPTAADVGAIPTSGGTISGPITFQVEGGAGLSQNYLSAGGGYSANSGKYGVKLVCCDQPDCQTGIGQDLTGLPNGYELSIAGGRNAAGDTGYISFAMHSVNSKVYDRLGYFDNDGNFYTKGQITEGGTPLATKYAGKNEIPTNYLPNTGGNVAGDITMADGKQYKFTSGAATRGSNAGSLVLSGDSSNGKTGGVFIRPTSTSSTSGGVKIIGGAILPENVRNMNLGASNAQWKDLFLTGSLSDGTNSVSVANIVKKSDLGRTTAVNAADTNYTTLMARGTSLHTSDTNPSVNGAICWTYK